MSASILDTDVFVSGGGPAGLAAAIAARMAGFRVSLADRCRPPIDKACGEGLMPAGVALLERLGVAFPFGSTIPFTGIRFVEGATVATARFRGRTGVGVRRTVLHGAMVRRAEDLGVDCLWETKVIGLRAEGVDLEDGPVRARWVVGAEGKNSPIRKGLGFDTPPLHQRIGLRRHYEVTPWSGFVEVHWSTGCEAYVTPVTSRLVCIAMLVRDPSLRFDDALASFPALRERLAGARIASRDMGDSTVVRRSTRVTSERVALVGEAAGSVDAITGEGITLSLMQSVALARALRRGNLGIYERDHRRLMRQAERMSALLLAIDRRPRLRRGSLSALARLPGLFSSMLAFHARPMPGMIPVMQPAPAGAGGGTIHSGDLAPARWNRGRSGPEPKEIR